MEQKDGKVLGKIHMEIAQLLPSKNGDKDSDLRLHSGLVELWLGAPSIKEKVQWHNAISDAIRAATDRDNLSDFGESEIPGGYQRRARLNQGLKQGRSQLAASDNLSNKSSPNPSKSQQMRRRKIGAGDDDTPLKNDFEGLL